MTAPEESSREPATDVEIQPAWRLDDPAVEADAATFWKRLGILPPDVVPEQRAKELVAVARRQGEVIGVSTATLEVYRPLRARMAVLRAAVDPDHRRTHAGIALGIASREILEKWAEEHSEEQVGGILAIIDNRGIGTPLLEPYWPNTRLNLIGFMPDGRQIRAYWFRHFRFSPSTAS